MYLMPCHYISYHLRSTDSREEIPAFHHIIVSRRSRLAILNDFQLPARVLVHWLRVVCSVYYCHDRDSGINYSAVTRVQTVRTNNLPTSVCYT